MMPPKAKTVDVRPFHLRLLAAPFLLSLVDAAVTLTCQPGAYWSEGYFGNVIEANPFVWVALSIHPLMLIPGFIGWYCIVLFLMFRCQAWIGLRFHVFLVLGHTVAICGGFLRFFDGGFMLSVAFVLIALPFAALLFRPFAPQWNSQKPVIDAADPPIARLAL